MLRWRAAQTVAIVLALVPVVPAAPLPAAEISPLATLAAYQPPAGSARLLRKWSGVLERHARAMAAPICAKGPGCTSLAWRQMLSREMGASRAEQILAVNSFVNAARYVSDEENWGENDYWESPDELFARGGDCEDYAIAKYFSLRALGLTQSDLRLVVLRERTRGEAHAVLLVRFGGATLVLDNLSSELTGWDALAERYIPIYSFNEDAAWIHAGAD
jgi:predicted transglutaminase-like cysteine proteinase